MITEKQKQALELASQGLSVVLVAEAMGISVRTVEHHLSEARSRLGAINTTHAVAKSIRLGLIKGLLFALCFSSASADNEVLARKPARVGQTVRIARTIQNRKDLILLDEI